MPVFRGFVLQSSLCCTKLRLLMERYWGHVRKAIEERSTMKTKEQIGQEKQKRENVSVGMDAAVEVAGAEKKVQYPKKRWFPLVLLCGPLVQWCILTVPFVIAGILDEPDIGIDCIFWMIVTLLWLVYLFFPIGLFGVFIWNGDIIGNYLEWFLVIGWIFYFAIMIAGIIRPRRLLLIFLVILLLLNIGGCWLPWTMEGAS